ncbi:serine/threonine protein phosphatase 1 [Mesorhizobium sp. YR577]|nr:serine/threonine protein phosphatase 1 [Mesorhizobium sp. YR577]
MSTGIHYLDAAGPEGMRIYAIGDVHGRRDLLEMMHARIKSELERDAPADWCIVHLGDYVDRGPDSKGVVQFLIDAEKRDSRIISLAGNHDRGFLDFLANPEPEGLFARYGGKETALSYGVDIDFTNAEQCRKGHALLMDAVPADHVTFLADLRYSASFGDFFFCHAGIRPGAPLDRQDSQDLIWIRGEFLNYPYLHPKVVVHGHTPHDEPEVMANRVNVDTLAYKSGKLTALVIDGAQKRILSVIADMSA